jgi:hypothetical protein
LTALWAFSESVVGGILHGFKVPLSGAWLSGFAAILISLMSLFSTRGEILKASIIVIIIKVTISPYTPLTAHIAVFLQGCLGEVFFLSKRFYKISAVLFAVTIIILSGIQRILILTILFGNTLWKSIDTYANIVISELFGNKNLKIFSASIVIISAYIFIHLVMGLVVGFIAGKLPPWINNNISDENMVNADFSEYDAKFPEVKRKKKRWWNKKSGRVFLSVLLLMVIYSYFHPELGKSYTIELIIMIVRSFVILFLWFTLVSPLLYKVFRKIIDKKQIRYISQTDKIISTFPELKRILFFNWKRSQEFKGYLRIKFFVTATLIMAMFSAHGTKISQLDSTKL